MNPSVNPPVPPEHLPAADLNALADGELAAEQLAAVREHLAGCPACTTRALDQALLKSATARAGRRYAPPPELYERLLLQGRQEGARQESAQRQSAKSPARGSGPLGWAVAALLLLVAGTSLVLQRGAHKDAIARADFAALVTEVADQHIATLAAGSPPQVVSTDRHTVKPWFQGKLPFSFNLPASLPADTTLDGANLTYIHNRPVAQLLYSIGRHRVSVFLTESRDAAPPADQTAEHAGFHLRTFQTPDLQAVAVSDVDPARLATLVDQIRQAQTPSAQSSR